MPGKVNATVVTGSVLAAVLGLFLPTGLSGGTGLVEAEGVTLHVSVAISLRPAVEEILESFRLSQPSVTTLLNGGGSTVLTQQALRGAPVDLLISASSVEIDRLVTAGLAVVSTRRRIASNRLVVVVPADSTPPSTVAELLHPEYDRVAIGNPRTAPVGRYARQALESLGLWRELNPRLVSGENARQVLDYVARGEVRAGLLYGTDALLRLDRVAIGPAISPEHHDPIFYEGVVLECGNRCAAAAALLEWLCSEPARMSLERRGFLPP